STVSGNLAQGGIGGGGQPAGLAGSSLGGGVYNAGTLTTDSDTAAANSVTAAWIPSNPIAGGGIYQASGTTTLKNTIVAGNTGPSGPDAFGPISSTGFNL